MTETSRSPKDLLALGQTIVRQLDLDDRGDVLERWMAHHLAELISSSETLTGEEQVAAEDRAVETILKIWSHRRSLPEPVDPLGGLRDAIAVLGRLRPEADPWRRPQRHQVYEYLLHDMFRTFTRSILAGILLTQVSRQRRVETAEAAVMANEELFLSSQIAHWIEYLDFPTASDSLQMIGDRSSPTGDLAEEGQDDSAAQDNQEHAADILGAETSLHGAVLANLERMQEDLSELIGKWRAASIPSERTEDEAEDED